ncbi:MULTISPECIES: hypothetical protein [Aeromicrobium]|uniref:hypothetical protein n=1 Tax=Aeromicrobium TaxID=2040 RepID=UPI00257BA882|nr:MULTISPECIES: hypothetical protein [Aeromicrobium]
MINRWNIPALGDGTRPCDIVDAIDTSDTAAANELTLALLHQFQNGQALAGRILLQEFMPNLWRMKASPGADSQRDRLQLVITEFWAIISSYPTGRGDRSVGGRIVLDTLNAVTRIKSRVQRQPDEVPVEEVVLTSVAGQRSEPHTGGLEDLLDLEALVAWARRNEILDHTDATLLLTALGTNDHVMNIRAACAATGLSNDAARRRVTRSRARLVEAAQRELQRGTLHVLREPATAGHTVQTA